MNVNTHFTTAKQRLSNSFAVDADAVLLILLFLIVASGGMWFANAMDTTPEEQTETEGNQAGSAQSGAALALLEVGVAVALLGLLAFYRRLPEALQSIVKYNALTFLVILLVVDMYHISLEIVGPSMAVLYLQAFVMSLFTAAFLVNEYDVYWIVNNILAIVLAIGVAGAVGYVLSVPALLVFLLGMTIYDWVFADKNEFMFDLAALLTEYRLPVLFVRPHKLQFDWNKHLGFPEETDEDEPLPETTWGIGMADLALAGAVPAALVSSTASYPVLMAALVVGGITLAALRLRKRMVDDLPGAGLPAITAGIGGTYAIGLVVSAVLVVVGL